MEGSVVQKQKEIHSLIHPKPTRKRISSATEQLGNIRDLSSPLPSLPLTPSPLSSPPLLSSTLPHR